MRPTDSTPTPTPREALSHLCWALTHGEIADEDIRVLSAALEQLEAAARALERMESSIRWVLCDAKYKAPEQFHERSEVWWARLSAAINPRHPLYVKGETEPVPFSYPEPKP